MKIPPTSQLPKEPRFSSRHSLGQYTVRAVRAWELASSAYKASSFVVFLLSSLFFPCYKHGNRITSVETKCETARQACLPDKVAYRRIVSCGEKSYSANERLAMSQQPGTLVRVLILVCRQLHLPRERGSAWQFLHCFVLRVQIRLVRLLQLLLMNLKRLWERKYLFVVVPSHLTTANFNFSIVIQMGEPQGRSISTFSSSFLILI